MGRVTTSPVLVSVSQDGEICIATDFVLQDSMVSTVSTGVSVQMAQNVTHKPVLAVVPQVGMEPLVIVPVLRVGMVKAARKPVTVLQTFQESPVTELPDTVFVHRDELDPVVQIPVLKDYGVMAVFVRAHVFEQQPVTHPLDDASVVMDGMERRVNYPVLMADGVRNVSGSANARWMDMEAEVVVVIASQALVNAQRDTMDRSAETVGYIFEAPLWNHVSTKKLIILNELFQDVLRESMGLTASSAATVVKWALFVMGSQEPATVLLDGPELLVNSHVQMDITVWNVNSAAPAHLIDPATMKPERADVRQQLMAHSVSTTALKIGGKNPNMICDPVDGSCHCRPGWQGPNCVSRCPAGFFGSKCQYECKCENQGVCHPDNGTCICAPGFYGERCSLPCPNGFYGRQCKQRCECIHREACHGVTGQCYCAAGYRGRHCEETCPRGSFGPECKFECPVCNMKSPGEIESTDTTLRPKVDWSQPGSRQELRIGVRTSSVVATMWRRPGDIGDVTCHPQTGECPCPPGTHGPGCEAKCPSGRFGPRCSQVCTCPQGATCSPVTGSCECPAGYYGPLCQYTCPPGYYGKGCAQVCDCYNTQPSVCDTVTGVCHCKPGYMGDRCEQICPQGYHGEMCAKACHQCEHCHFETGQCLCELGKEGETCGGTCPNGQFGAQCSETCNCRNGATCLPSTGMCQCPSWLIGPDCGLQAGQLYCHLHDPEDQLGGERLDHDHGLVHTFIVALGAFVRLRTQVISHVVFQMMFVFCDETAQTALQTFVFLYVNSLLLDFIQLHLLENEHNKLL
ncbi:EGF-like domain protein, partial [Opisthorchis viverrini]